MRFDKGVVGVVIVVIALFGTIFAGYFLNVDQETVTVTKYDRLTDVSSLFDYSQQPDFVEYNPAKNYTGYMSSDGVTHGIDYTVSSNANQYFMDSSSAQSTTFNPSSYLNLNNGVSRFVKCYPYANDGTYVWAYMKDGYNYPQRNTLASFVPDIVSSAPSGTTSIVISLADSDYYLAGNNPSMLYRMPFYSTTETQYEIYSIANSGYNAHSGWETNGSLFVDGSDITITIDMSDTSRASINYGGVVIEGQTQYLYLYQKTNKQLRIQLPVQDSSVHDVVDYPLSGNNNLNVTYVYDTQYSYMNVSKGVNITTEPYESTTWSNGKTIGDVGIIFHTDYGYGGSGVFPKLTLQTNVGDFRLYIGGNSLNNEWNVTSRYFVGSSYTDVNIGSWDSFIIHLSAIEGKIYVVPILQFNSFVDYVVADYRIEIADMSTTPFTSVIYKTSAGQQFPKYMWTISVASTMVYMSTKTLMVDPAIDITKYFSLPEGYRLDINSFAKYGNSITVNGLTLYGDENGNPISKTNTVYVNGNTYKLNNIQIMKDTLDGHTYLNFVNDRKKIDMGATTTDVMSMAGTWYFNTTLNEGKISESTEYTWDWANALTSTQSIVVFMGLIVVFSLLARRFWTIKILDLAVIVSSIVLLWTVAGVI